MNNNRNLLIGKQNTCGLQYIQYEGKGYSALLYKLESVGVFQILLSVPTLLTQGVKFILCELSLYYVS